MARSMAEEESLKVGGVGIRFRAALELLIQAHEQDLAIQAHAHDLLGRSEHAQEIHVHSIPEHTANGGDRHDQHLGAVVAQKLVPSSSKLPSGTPSNTSSLKRTGTLSDWLGEQHLQGNTTLVTGVNISEDIEVVEVTPKPEAEGEGEPYVSEGSSEGHENHNRGAGNVHSSAHGLFASVKEQLGDDTAIDEEEYDVAQYYHKQGWSQAIARSDIFGNFTLAIISINSVYMGVDSDYNRAESLNEADLVFIIFENLFCLFFTLELWVRFSAFERKGDCLKDGWFKFDSCLLLVIWLETWIMPLLVEVADIDGGDLPTGPMRLMRLLRLARLSRLLRAFPELVTMIKGMFVATRAVGSAMLLLVIAIYAWGIAMHSFMKDDEDVFMYWGTVTRCMMTLMANGTLGDSIGTVMRGVARNVPALTALIAFVVFSALTVLNMLVGVLCEVVTEVAHAEKDSIALSKLKSTLLIMLKRLDADGSGDISKYELLGLLQDEQAEAVMRELSINTAYLVDHLDMHYQGTENVKIPQIMQLLIDSQGDRATTVADLCAFSTFSHWSMRREFERLCAEVNLLKSSSKSTSFHVAMLQDLANIKKDVVSVHNSIKSFHRDTPNANAEDNFGAPPPSPRNGAHKNVSDLVSLPAIELEFERNIDTPGPYHWSQAVQKLRL